MEIFSLLNGVPYQFDFKKMMRSLHFISLKYGDKVKGGVCHSANVLLAKIGRIILRNEYNRRSLHQYLTPPCVRVRERSKQRKNDLITASTKVGSWLQKLRHMP